MPLNMSIRNPALAPTSICEANESIQVRILKETAETGTGKIQRRKRADSVLVKDEPKVKLDNI
jgi:hypothetical protein